jgi:tRNA modification GTPase
LAGTSLRLDDTIVALATPRGRGALAVVRLSGAEAFEFAAAHIRPWPLPPRTAARCTIFDGTQMLDDAVVTAYPAPRSFTGEDVVEVSSHGGYAVPASVIAAFVQAGARPAMPGEFTRRAVLNGKLDLVQAEGVGELVNARSSAMQQAALAQVRGILTAKLNSLRSDILGLEALVAYDIDFPSEDDGPVADIRVTEAARQIEHTLNDLLSTASFGRVIREGASIVIAGPPNAGKSSLFNALIGSARAIVTDIPGTTRDALDAVIDTGEWVLRFVDTAGLREADEAVERLGIEVSESYLLRADVALACADKREDVEETAARLRALTNAPILKVWTKADLPRERERTPDAISVSAQSRVGLSDLLSRISDTLAESYGRHSAEEPVITTARQHAALTRALAEIRSFTRARSADRLPAAIAAVHLREATTALEELIGAVDLEDVLSRLFSTFCIGK